LPITAAVGEGNLILTNERLVFLNRGLWAAARDHLGRKNCQKVYGGTNPRAEI